MATLYAQVERMRTARDNLVRVRSRVELSAPAPDQLPRRRNWVAREILAHVDEMLPYWLGEIERVIAGAVEPVPFGREESDLVRILTIDRDRTLPVSELYGRLDNSLERVLRRMLELDERQVARRGLRKRGGEMTVREIVDTMLAGHLEEHCRQLVAALEAERVGSRS
jgi:predicted nucleic acid-binding protein